MTVMAIDISDEPSSRDERIFMHVDWEGYEALERARGERVRPRITYLDGIAELVSPSLHHEKLAEWINALVQTFCIERGIIVQPFGSWTLRDPIADAAAEADKCFVFGNATRERPDLAIEVVWRSGGLEKLEVWRRLRVREVWFWIDHAINVYVLGPVGYERRARSVVLPDLDLALVVELLAAGTLNDAVAQLRASL